MILENAKQILEDLTSSKSSATLKIVIHQPGGLAGTPGVAVKAIHAGFDWDSNSILIYPEENLTTLTIEQVADITKSVSNGQSWHSYEKYKKHKQELSEAQTVIARLQAELEKYSNS